MASFQNSLPLGTCEHGNGIIWKYSLCRLNQVKMRSPLNGELKVSVAQSFLFLATPWTVARQVSLSMGFSRQEHWSGLPFPSPGDLPDTGVEPRPPTLAGGVFTV